jgi:hypothetical protein
MISMLEAGLIGGRWQLRADRRGTRSAGSLADAGILDLGPMGAHGGTFATIYRAYPDQHYRHLRLPPRAEALETARPTRSADAKQVACTDKHREIDMKSTTLTGPRGVNARLRLGDALPKQLRRETTRRRSGRSKARISDTPTLQHEEGRQEPNRSQAGQIG